LRENKILDSLTQDAKSKGYDLNIVYVKPSSKQYSEKKAFPDDSTGTSDPTDPGNSDPADSSVVNYTSFCGTLLNRDSYVIENMSIGSGYVIELEGYVSASSRFIRGVSSKTYHNLQFMSNNLQSCLLTTETGGNTPIESTDYILYGSSVMNGPVDYISVYYYNSEINKDITWSCNYMIVYYLPQSYS